MSLYLIFFVSSILLGLTILELLKIYFPTPFKLASAFTLGTVANLLLLFLIASIFGLNFIISTIVICFGLATGAFFLRRQMTIKDFKWDSLVKNLKSLTPFSPLLIIIILIFYKAIYITKDSIIAGNRLVWVDWPIHISLISSFLSGNNFPPQNPLHSGGITTYPFFIEFLSAVLLSLGATLKNSLVLPGIILSLLSVALLYIFGRIFFYRRSISLVGLYIGLFCGGLGFYYFFQDIINSQNFLGTLLFPPKEYTFYTEKNLWFFTFLYSELLPQRAFLLGIPLFFTSIILLITGITKNKKIYLLTAALTTGIMPFFHIHSFISVVLFSTVFISLTIINIIKTDSLKAAGKLFFNISIHYLLPIIGLGFIQLPVFLKVAGQSFAPHFGWLKGDDNFFIFWFKNTGFYWPLWIIGYYTIKEKITKNILIASLSLFILPNLFRFAPWPYDNLKIFTYWYLIGAFAVAASLINLWQKNFVFKILTVFLFISLTMSGLLEIVRILNTPKTSVSLWNKDDIELSKAIMQKTEPRSIILTAPVHDHPVTSLAGRYIIIGFPGNAWSWGYADWQQREQDVKNIYDGNPSAPVLLDKYGVNYVLISPKEESYDPSLNETYFAENFEIVAAGKNFKLFFIK